MRERAIRQTIALEIAVTRFLGSAEPLSRSVGSYFPNGEVSATIDSAFLVSDAVSGSSEKGFEEPRPKVK